MTSATVTAPNPANVAVPQVRFGVATRPMRRYANEQTINILAGPTSFAPISLNATGFVRKIALFFTFSGTCASAAAIVAGDGPWNLITGISLTDATGTAITQPISAFNLRLVNKWLPTGTNNFGHKNPFNDPHVGSDYNYSGSGTVMSAKFRLDLELEIDPATGYGSIPNLDANASLQLKIDAAQYSVAFSGTTVSAATLTCRVEQHYWAPIPGTIDAQSVQTVPPGFGDYLELRYENQVATASAENTANLTARGGFIRGIIAVSRAAGVRTDYMAGTSVGLVYDNNPIDEGIRLESFLDGMRRDSGFIGADLTTSYAPLTPGVLPGADRGVLVWDFDAASAGRESWLPTRPGTLLQTKFTPGASATQVEFITVLCNAQYPDVLFGPDPA